MRTRWAAGALLLAMAWATQARAGVVIYRCTDAFGRLTVQNDVPCPKGSQQRRQVVDTPPPMPAYRPAPPLLRAVAPVPLVDAPPPSPATPLPPPPLFRCHTPDGDNYLSEDGTPSPRCIAQQVVDAAGNPNPAAAACEVERDTCERIPDGAACAAWQERARETEAAWRFSRPESLQANRAEYERIQRVLRESTCASTAPAK